MKKRKKLRQTISGKKIEALLYEMGYKGDSINKFFQNRLNPSVKKAYEFYEKFNFPIDAWLDVHAYLEKLEKEREKTNKES